MEKSEAKLALAALLALALTAVTVSLLLIVVYSSPVANLDGRKFCKKFTGATDTIEGNVLITDADTGAVYFNGTPPDDYKICIRVGYNTELIIQWKDWRGQMEERHVVDCSHDTDELVNCIPYPKSGSQAGEA